MRRCMIIVTFQYITCWFGARSFAINWLAITCNQNQLLPASSSIDTFAIKLIHYQLSCDHFHLLLSLICIPALTAIDTFAIKSHFLSGQLAVNPQLQSKILQSIIICYTIFDLLSIFNFTNFFLKNPQKMKNFSKFWILYSLAYSSGHGAGTFCCLK